MTTITRRKWTNREIEFVKSNYGLLSQKEMADRLGRPAGSVQGLIKRLKIPKIPTQREFAVYQGDKFMFIGTMDYACERLGVTEKTFRFYLCPAYEKRSNRNSIHVVDLGLWKIEDDVI